MKKSIKAMSVFMSAMLTLGSLGAVSLTAGAQESIGTVTKITSGDFVYTVEDNVATIVDYTGSANALVIPQTIDGRKIVRIGDYALSKKAKLNSVVVPESVESIGRACRAIAEADESRGDDFVGAHIQGIYLEGPFFTMKHVGAQNPEYLIDPSYEVFKGWQEKAGGRIVKSALAPERDGSEAYIAALDAEGVVTSIGHSDATYEEALAAVNAGATCFVHTYNGMRGLHHREPGTLGCAMSTPETYAEVICDGKHVQPAAIKALVRAKGWQHSVLITDCLGCGGLPEGHYMSGGLPVVMDGGLCYLENEDGTKGNIAGSVLTLARGVKNIVDWGVASADEAIRMATEVAARSARIDGVCGSIKPGRDADFVVFDHELNLRETYLAGETLGSPRN